MIRIIIGIMSSPHAVLRHQWIRETWLTKLPETVNAKFVVSSFSTLTDPHDDILFVNEP